MTMMRFFTQCLTLACTLVLLGSPSVAQNQFAPAVKVNDQVVTNFEVAQRIQFLTLLRAPGNPNEQALKALISERLKVQAANAAGITVNIEDLEVGMAEFAARAKK